MRGLARRTITWDSLPTLDPRKGHKKRCLTTRVIAKAANKRQGRPPSASEPNGNVSRLQDPTASRFANNYRALVLDSTYQPIDVITWQRAICLDLFDKVDVLEYYDMHVRSAYDQHFLPAVLRVRVFVSRQSRAHTMSISRRNIMMRDCYTCQYCGTNSNLTIDHIVPASKGGAWEWTNLVTACTKCNGKKGNKSLKQLKWSLKREPREPSACELSLLLGIDMNISTAPKEWMNYLYELKRTSQFITDGALGDELAGMTDLAPGATL